MTNSPLIQPEHRALFVRSTSTETFWRLHTADTAAPTEVQVPLGDPASLFLCRLLLAGLELRAEPEQLPRLLELLDDALATDTWTSQLGSDAKQLVSGTPKECLRSAARSLRTKGLVPAAQAAKHAAVEDHLVIPSPGHYAALQQALAMNTFQQVDGSRFPRAALTKGGARGYAELRPITPDQELLMSPEEADALAQKMWQQREELSDKDADTLDAISAAWLKEARAPSDRVGIYIDEILAQRGLKPKKGGHGRRGGFEPEQRADLWRCLLHLQELWLDIAEAAVVEHDARGRRKRTTRTLQSRAFVLTDRVGQRRLDGSMDVEAILVTPGEAFGRFLLGPGRQVALLSSAALQYDPFRRRVEKRLARYLSWQWRVGAHKADFLRVYRVQTLLEEVDLDPSREPGRARNRLETALDRLEHDRVISSWQYHESWNEDHLPRQGWLGHWLEARLVIEAPDLIKEAYRNLDQLEHEGSHSLPAASTWGERLRQHRQGLGLTQMQAAEELEISQAYVAQIERGRKPSRNVQQKLEAWFASG